MGHRISKEFLHPNVKDDVNKLVGDLSKLETNDKSSIVAAFNETFVLENGKKIIADTIGSPLLEEDDYSIMANKIDILLSIFGDKLIEKGVSVNPSAKLNDLINLISDINSENHNYPNWYNGFDIWIQAERMPTSSYITRSCAVNGKLHVLNGYKGDGSRQNYHHQYDVNTNKWTNKTNMSNPRGQAMYCSVGKIMYAIGGLGDSSNITNEAYDSNTDTWSSKENMPRSDYAGDCCLVGTDIYCLGGYSKSNSNYKYDTILNTWTTEAVLPVGRYQLVCEHVNNKIYTIGGYNSSNRNDCYDVSLKSWTVKAVIPSSGDHTMSSVAEGKYVILLGGWSGNKYYDTELDNWINKKNPPITMRTTTASIIDHKVFVVGGANDSSTAMWDMYMYIPEV